jgi:two-component system, OmpR family, sensor histidine kinase SaeS
VQTTRASLVRLALPWLGIFLGLTLAIGCGLFIAELLMSPPSSELWDLGVYLALAGVASSVVAWAVIRLTDRVFGLSIQAKSLLNGLIAGAVALLNVFIVAQLMFISTDHDLKLLVAVIAFSAIVTASLSLWLARSIADRLGVITRAIRRLAAEELGTRLHLGGGDEVARLADDVNALAQRLEAAREQRAALDRERRELTQAISHDLRTPLASLRAMVEALDDGVVEGEEVDRYYNTMRREVDKLSRMIDDLFELAQLDAGTLRLNLTRLAADEVVAEVVDGLQPHARHHGIELVGSNDVRVVASLDGSRIERALSNLVRNAIEHTPEGGRVEVRAMNGNGFVEFSVSDTGEGIDPADLPRIWNRFYRAEKSRRRSAGNLDGAGLGLAIVRGIAEAHGGSVSAESVAGQGATFILRLPDRPS